MRAYGWTIGLALAMIATLGAAEQPLVRITLRDKTAVAEATVRLGDIAELIPLTDDARRHLNDLARLPIVPAPLPRYLRTVTTGEVATKLAQAGWRNGEFVLDGAKQVVVERKGRALTVAELEALLQKALGTPVKLLLPPPSLVLPDGEVTVQAEMPSSPRAMLPITLSVNGQPIVALKVLAQFPAATKKPSPLHAPRSMLHAPFAVQRRQTVRLIARVGRVVVEARGTVLQDGRIGDEILVSVVWSKSPLRGVVTGEREVTVATW